MRIGKYAIFRIYGNLYIHDINDIRNAIILLTLINLIMTIATTIKNKKEIDKLLKTKKFSNDDLYWGKETKYLEFLLTLSNKHHE